MSTEFANSPMSRPVVVIPTKSVGIQILLVVFLGPLGLFYSTIKGALFMLFGVPVIAAILASVLAGIAHGGAALLIAGSGIALLVVFEWVGSFVLGVLAVNAHNRALMAAA